MPKRLDKVNIIAVETTCWAGFPPPGQHSEIIEVGVCTLDVTSGKRENRKSLLVKPERSEISRYCTAVTTLTQKQVENGLSFKAALQILKTEYFARDRIWASYGNSNRRIFKKQCKLSGEHYPFGASHVNIKSLLAFFKALPVEVNLRDALNQLNLPQEANTKRAVNEAWSSALILSKLMMETRFKYVVGAN